LLIKLSVVFDKLPEYKDNGQSAGLFEVPIVELEIVQLAKNIPKTKHFLFLT